MIVFCFSPGEYEEDNMRPITLYDNDLEDRFGTPNAREKIHKAIESLPKDMDEYTDEEATAGSWVRFHYNTLVYDVCSNCENEKLESGEDWFCPICEA